MPTCRSARAVSRLDRVARARLRWKFTSTSSSVTLSCSWCSTRRVGGFLSRGGPALRPRGASVLSAAEAPVVPAPSATDPAADFAAGLAGDLAADLAVLRAVLRAVFREGLAS